MPLGDFIEDETDPDPSLAHKKARNETGSQSMSNGSMMRITPLAVWARNLTVAELEKCILGDVGMMHTNPNMLDACTVYCIAIKTLI